MAKAVSPVAREKWWRTHGPYENQPERNAFDHLCRFNFEIDAGVIYPPRGFMLSREDRMAIDYLVSEHGYEYSPSDMQRPVKPPAGSTPPS